MLLASPVAVMFFLSVASGLQQDEHAESKRRGLKALFSFTSPGSLFPPSAIISLTDDNSTFFLARPAAFGPSLPQDGLSSPLWIGSGFGDDVLGQGELGCGDSPDWDDRDGLTQASRLDKSHADIQSLQKAAEIQGKVALLKRGGCGFLAKVQWAQNRGAVAVIVGDHVRGGALIRMYAKGDTSNITIPSLFTSHTTAHLLSSLLPSRGSRDGGSGRSSSSSSNHGMLSNVVDHHYNKKPSSEVADKDDTRGEYDLRLPSSSSRFTPKAGPLPQPDRQDTELSATVPWEKKPKIWLDSIFNKLGLGYDDGGPPRSRSLGWDQDAQWAQNQAPFKTRLSASKPIATWIVSGSLVIGEQDWRDPAPASSGLPPGPVPSAPRPNPATTQILGNALPRSREYTHPTMTSGQRKSWWSRWFSPKPDKAARIHEHDRSVQSSADQVPGKKATPTAGIKPHEGLWVTLTPTNVSTSPFFDTLLVLVVSPLVTLTVVYALLLLRSRIRRRRWRAPKSLVERLPVRTYQTISESSPSATPSSSSPTTPLLQHSPPQPVSPVSITTPQVEVEAPATSSSIHHHRSRTREEEKRDNGLAEWRRRYGGRQKECVVCLEEYVDGVSQVMSLPCGHEFHADCITPWLVTRRRTCPICKGDVVRSLAQSYHDHLPSLSPTRAHVHPQDVSNAHAQEAEPQNYASSSSAPMLISATTSVYHPRMINNDVEANWSGDGATHYPENDSVATAPDATSSAYNLSSTVSTVIWRGFEAVRNTTGLQRHPPDDVDRNR